MRSGVTNVGHIRLQKAGLYIQGKGGGVKHFSPGGGKMREKAGGRRKVRNWPLGVKA
jgi:hypothetical protein